MQELREALSTHFGYGGFRPGQEAIIQSVLSGRPTLAILPTGGGKSLCFQLPALLLEGTTVVASPLVALMKDQIDFLVSKGIKAARLDSTVGFEESRQTYSDLRAGILKLLYVAPERLNNEREDFRSDIYSLGATLFHAIAGRPTFEDQTQSAAELKKLKTKTVRLREVAPDVSAETARIIKRMLQVNPAHRYQSYDELMGQLRAAQAAVDRSKRRLRGKSGFFQRLFDGSTTLLSFTDGGFGIGRPEFPTRVTLVLSFPPPGPAQRLPSQWK